MAKSSPSPLRKIIILTDEHDHLRGIRSITKLLQDHGISLTKNCFCAQGLGPEQQQRLINGSPQLVIFMPKHETEVKHATEIIDTINPVAVTVVVLLEGTQVKPTSKFLERKDLLVAQVGRSVPSLVKHFLDGHTSLDKLKEFFVSQSLSPAPSV